MSKGDNFCEVQNPSDMGAYWSEGLLVHSTLLRTEGAEPVKWASLEKGVCVSSPLARVVLKKTGGLGNSNFRIKTTESPVTFRMESGTINQNLSFEAFIIVNFCKSIFPVLSRNKALQAIEVFGTVFKTTRKGEYVQTVPLCD